MSEDRTRMALRLLRPDIEVVLTPLYMPDDRLAELVLGQQAGLWRPELVRRLEREGLPPRRELLGTMRYLPSVFEFFARREGLRQCGPGDNAPDGSENFGSM